MTAAALLGKRTSAGVRPFNPCRDIAALADLIAVAFGDELDPTGQVALAEMRRFARWGPLLWWICGMHWGGVPPGFVWVSEAGSIVGNVSLRRGHGGWGGFFVGNVAVHPDWRGQGIARRLMEAALEAISARGGRWVGLEVRAENEAARGLYQSLGFEEMGRTGHMLRPADLPWPGEMPHHPLLRRGRAQDSAALFELARTMVSEAQRPLLELRREEYRPGWERTLDCWLQGRREAWWVVQGEQRIRGAVRALRERGRRPHRLEILISPEPADTDEEPLERALVQQGLSSLGDGRRKMVETTLTKPTEALVAALEAEGFHELSTLIQMRLHLVRSVQVRVRRPGQFAE